MNAIRPASLIGVGLYPLREAARLVQIDPRTASRWAKGHRRSSRGAERFSPGVVPLRLPPVGNEVDLTFAEMLTLRLVRAFRAAGLGLPTIRRVAERAAVEFGMPLPFTSRRFRTDGRKIFVEMREAGSPADGHPAAGKERKLIDVLTGQQQFAEIVEPSLFANVEFVDDLAASWWPLGKTRAVVLDPDHAFGAPRLRDTGVTTSAVSQAVQAEGGGREAARIVAHWFSLPLSSVDDAVSFETEWLTHAA